MSKPIVNRQLQQSEDVLTSELAEAILQGLALEKVHVAKIKSALGPTLTDLQKVFDQPLSKTGEWTKDLNYARYLLQLLLKLKIELEKVRSNDSAIVRNFETKVKGVVADFFAEKELVSVWEGLHLMSTRYSGHPVWVELNKDCDLDVKASDIATAREFAGLSSQ
ncbi:hypothetical protein N0V86_009145 [Didymella sp. IMI 355093]|nr:hypothetical protein N0V86_009145 [Didymella sp. IMI 355093]